MTNGVGSDAEETPCHRGRRRLVHTRAQGPALPHPGGGPQGKAGRLLSGGSDAVEYLHARRKAAASDVFVGRNSGIESRANRDKLELMAVNDGSDSYAALERKAELYEKLCGGELPDEEEKEKYCVDFFTKSLVQEEAEQPEIHNSPGVPPVSEDDDADAVSLATKLVGPGHTGVTMDQDEHKCFVREVHEEASEAREKSSLLKLHRQEQEVARREKLKQAYLRKQLEKLKAAKTEPSRTTFQLVQAI